MAFTTNMTAVANVDDSIILEFDQQFIIAQEDEGVMEQFISYRKNIGAKSIEFPKYSQLALATTPLDEDDDVTSAALTDSQIILTPAEYGNVVTRTQLANLQTGGKVDVAAARLVGLNSGRTQDKLAILAAEASANVSTVDGGAIGDLAGTDIMTASFLNKLYNSLAKRNIQALSNGLYVVVMHDDQIHDLRDSAGSGSWQDINKYTSSEQILKNEVGMLAGFRVVRDNNCTIFADTGAGGTVDVYKALCLGFNALGKAVSLEPQMVMSGPFDKLSRFVNIGWKGCFQYGIIDSDAIQLGVTSSSVGANT